MKRILIVDDEPDIVTYLEMIPQDNGFATDTATNGNEALEKVRSSPPALVTLDVDMPGISGFELTEKLRENDRTREKPVIIVTSRATKEDKRKGISVGAQGYIVKGAFDQNVLLDTVKSLIGD